MDFVDIQSTVILGLILAGLFIATMRAPPRRRRWVIGLLPLPTCFFIYRWASFKSAWNILALSFLLGGILIAAWWMLWGRNLPPPDEQKIRIWTKDDPF